MRALRLILVLLLSGVFIYAGCLKVWNPEAFMSSILTYDVFPYNWAVGSALVVPYIEVLAGIALLIPSWRKTGEVIIGGMLIIFIVLILQAFFRGLSIDCGCFGPKEASDSSSYQWVLLRDFGLLACLAVFVWLDRQACGCSKSGSAA